MDLQSFHSLGFSEKEAEVYMTLNTYGPSPASTLARLTNIKRTSMYDVLNSLLAHNLIVTFKQGAYTYYAIDDINKLFIQEKERLRLAETVVRDLKAAQIAPQTVQITHFKGEEGYWELYQEIVKTKPKEVMVWINLDEFTRALTPEREDWFTRERVRYNIYARLLIQNTPLGRELQKEDKKSCRQTILLPKKYPFQSSCVIYDGHVTYFDSQKGITGIRIRHEGIFGLQKQVFEMNWKLFS